MAEDQPVRLARGRRVRELREGMGLGGQEFADRLNAAARSLGLPATYDKPKLSKAETGVRDLSPEDIAVLEEIDPQRRGWRWFAFGLSPSLADLIDPARDRKLTREEEERALRAAEEEDRAEQAAAAAAKKTVGKRSRSRG